MNWWLFSCIASATFALTIGGVLIAFWLADRATFRARRIMRDLLAESERQLAHGDGCPWPLASESSEQNLQHEQKYNR